MPQFNQAMPFGMPGMPPTSGPAGGSTPQYMSVPMYQPVGSGAQ